MKGKLNNNVSQRLGNANNIKKKKLAQISNLKGEISSEGLMKIWHYWLIDSDLFHILYYNGYISNTQM